MKKIKDKYSDIACLSEYNSHLSNFWVLNYVVLHNTIP